MGVGGGWADGPPKKVRIGSAAAAAAAATAAAAAAAAAFSHNRMNTLVHCSTHHTDTPTLG